MPGLPMSRSFEETMLALPQVSPQWKGITPRQPDHPIAVLDDDPTGTQTVHDVPVVTTWSAALLAELLRETQGVFFILTNSRAIREDEAVAMNREIAANLSEAASRVGTEFDIVSRSDSTLRGHYPAEIEALRETLEQTAGMRYSGELIVPCFFEGGRYTIDDTHYVREGSRLVPAGETEYAADHTFGYSSSNLRDWVAEKSGGRVKREEVVSIGLELLRREGPSRVAEVLSGLDGYRAVVVNAADYDDLSILGAALTRCREGGKRYLYRTAASFVRSIGAVTERSLLTGAELSLTPAGGTGYDAGLVVVGSYIRKSSDQLSNLLDAESIDGVELSVERVLASGGRGQEVERVSREIAARLEAGRDVALYTSRKLVATDSADRNLDVGRLVSKSLVQVVAGLSRRPRFIVAKGGITSSDVATEALRIERATVLGQVLPGVPVWRAGEGSKFPGLDYVVFPGNVGDARALLRVYETVSNR